VIADLTGFPGGELIRRCDTGKPKSAYQALVDVRLTPARGTGETTNGKYGYLCRITGLPQTTDDACTGFVTGKPSWAFSVPNAARTAWTTPDTGVDQFAPAVGEVLGFSYGSSEGATTNQPSVSVQDAIKPAAPRTRFPGAGTPTPSASPSAPAATDPSTPPISSTAVRAATFLAEDLHRNGDTYAAEGASGNLNTSLVADAVLALHAAGVAPAEARAATARLRATPFPATTTSSGLVAKLLLVALDQGVDPHRWGADTAGHQVDLVRRLGSTLDAGGRFANAGAAKDPSTTSSQALAIVALHRYAASGRKDDVGEAQAVAYLLRQQCPGGGFRSVPTAGQPACISGDGGEVSVESTAMAVWALVTVGHQKTPVDLALSWLVGKRDRTGGFGTDSSTAASIAGSVNAVTTGLAARALATAGDHSQPTGCSSWLGRLQLPADSGPAQVRGAIAASPADHAALASAPAAYLRSAGNADRLRESTAQAVLGMAASPVGQPVDGRSYQSTGNGSRAGRPKAATDPQTRVTGSLPTTGPSVVPLMAIGVLLVLLGMACVVTPGPSPSNELLGWLQRRSR
jgi:hypothetical protein